MSGDGRTAVVFPGLAGSTFQQVGRFMVLDRYVRARLAVADEVLGESLLTGLRDSDGDYDLYAQVAFLVNSLALADRAEREAGRPHLCTAASFGHRAVPAYTGSLGFPDTIRLAVDLARCEQEYFAAEPEDLVTHCFVRVPDGPLHELVAEHVQRGDWVEVSAYLDPGFYLVSLRAELLDGLVRSVRQLGGYSMQTIRPAVHAHRFAGLRRRVEADVLPRFRLADPVPPVVADQDGRLVSSAQELRAMLLDGFDRPINWPAVTAALSGQGVRTVYVTGPDLLFHRLTCMTGCFRVVPVTPRTVSGPHRGTERIGSAI
jgi:[acyl-carrier-protein] S-malonyltransferase